jgi:hypothetical protein
MVSFTNSLLTQGRPQNHSWRFQYLSEGDVDAISLSDQGYQPAPKNAEAGSLQIDQQCGMQKSGSMLPA